MTVAHVATLGTANSNASGTTLAITTTATAVVDSYVFVLVAKDNVATVDGVTSEVTSVVDSAGNTYDKIDEYAHTAGGAANDGAVSALYAKKLGAQLASGGTITITFSSAIVAKAATADNFSVGSGNVLRLFGTPSRAGGSNITDVSGTFGLLRLRTLAYESSSSTLTATAGWTVIPSATSAGAMLAWGEWIVDGTYGATSSATSNNSRDSSQILASFIEESSTQSFTLLGGLGTTISTSSHSSSVITTTATAEAGNLVVVRIAKDNVQTTDGQTSEVTGVTDSAGGNTWVKCGEYTNGQASAAAGATVAVWASYLTNTIASGGTITSTFSSAVAQSSSAALEFTAPVTGVDIGSLQVLAGDNAQPGSQTISGLSSAETLWFRASSYEGNPNSLTPSSGFLSDQVVGTGAGGMYSLAEFAITTATGATSNPTVNTARDNASVFFAIRAPLTAALTGQSSTASRGVLGVSTSTTAVAGQAGTTGQGALLPIRTADLVGAEVTSAQGSLTPDFDYALAGMASTAESGNVGADISIPLTGLEATVSAGTLVDVTGAIVDLTGLEAAVSAGTLATDNSTELAGQAASVAQGNLAASPEMAGQAAAAAVGSVGISISIQLTGLGTSAALGALNPDVYKTYRMLAIF